MNTNLDGISDLRVYESSKGEWVKYEDVKEALKAHGDWIIRGFWNKPTYLQPGIKVPECNCVEKCQDLWRYWQCPAHGYKRR